MFHYYFFDLTYYLNFNYDFIFRILLKVYVITMKLIITSVVFMIALIFLRIVLSVNFYIP